MGPEQASPWRASRRDGLEPRAGGQIIDRGVKGAESRWATILSYEPPTHVAFSWDIDPAWQIESDPTKRSEVRVTFTAQGPPPILIGTVTRTDTSRGRPGRASLLAPGVPREDILVYHKEVK